MVGKEVVREIVREVGICGGGGGVEEEEGRRSEGVGKNSGREKAGAGKKTKAQKKELPGETSEGTKNQNARGKSSRPNRSPEKRFVKTLKKGAG